MNLILFVCVECRQNSVDLLELLWIWLCLFWILKHSSKFITGLYLVCLCIFFSEQYDIAYERMSMLFNAALWYMKHAVKYAANEE